MSKEEFEAIKTVDEYLRGMANQMTVRSIRNNDSASHEEALFWVNSFVRYNNIYIKPYYYKNKSIILIKIFFIDYED